jgi:hypothetical protein
MEKKSKYFYITIISILLSAGFFQDTSRAEENVDSFSENEPASQGKSANKSQKDGIQKNHSFMGLKDIEAGKPKPTKKEIDISSDKNIETAKVPEKQPGWFEKTFWLSFRGWVKENNRNDPNNEDQP